MPNIVYELLRGKRRFNELGLTIGGCNCRTLRDRLRYLEQLGIVSRHSVPLMPPWLEYELTPAGHELAEALTSLTVWGSVTWPSRPRRPRRSAALLSGLQAQSVS